MTVYLVPLIFVLIFSTALYKKVDIFAAFTKGAVEGLKTSIQILPALIILMTAISMFKSSGALDWIISFLKPTTTFLNLPSEVLPLAFLRPMSGSGALSLFEDILKQYGAESFLGRVASVIMGSTETTFYTIAVYYGAVKIKHGRHTLSCALLADLVGFIMSVLLVRAFF